MATFEGQGPAQTLVQALQRGQAPQLAAGLAGYMAVQLLHSQHPLPDLIIPVPQPFFSSVDIGYSPAFLLAHHLSRVLCRPMISPLKRSWPLLHQHQLNTAQRHRLSASQFQWRKLVVLQGKVVLLIDDEVGTGATLRACAQRLTEAFPAKVIKLALLRNDDVVRK
jgi:ComF family protein